MSVVKLNEGPALPTSVTLFVWKEQIWKVRGFVSLKPESFSFALLHVSALSDSYSLQVDVATAVDKRTKFQQPDSNSL